MSVMNKKSRKDWLNKVLNIYKPTGITSHDLVEQVRKNCPGQKIGHGGTLDPLASGVMLIGVGKATKKLGHLSRLSKVYRAKVAFGLKSLTDDLDSNDIEQVKIPVITKKRLKRTLTAFRGEFKQKVPLFSASHYLGKKLYQRARKGEIIPYDRLPAKIVKIKSIKIISFEPDGFKYQKKSFPLVDLKISCSSGTYIRSIARDLGRKFDSSAIVVDLIRTKIGDYHLKDSIKLTKKSS